VSCTACHFIDVGGRTIDLIEVFLERYFTDSSPEVV